MYSSMWKYRIMKNLHKFGLRGRLPNLINKFSSERNFKVNLGLTLSNLQKQEEGVPLR